MRQLSDDSLLTLLADALEAPDVHPEAAEFERLRSLLKGPGALPVVSLPVRDGVHPLRRLRHPIAAAATAAILISGSAAAAVGTDTLPGPLRTIAFNLGLPVDSPALEAADGDMSALENALDTGNLVAARLDATLLRAALVRLDPSDRVQIWVAAQQLLARADAALAAQGDGPDHGASGTPAATTGSPRHDGDGSGPTSQTNGSTAEGGTRDGSGGGGSDDGSGGATTDGGSGSGTSGPSASTGSSGSGSSGGQTSGGRGVSDGGGPGPGGTSGPVSSGGSGDGSNSGSSDGPGASTTSRDGSGMGTSDGGGTSSGPSGGGGSDGDGSSGSSGSHDRQSPTSDGSSTVWP